MFDFLIYLAQSSLCLAALYLIYKVAMSHETLHVFNRVILLGSVILSALLPLCRVKVVKEYDVAPTVASIEVDDMVLVENVPELGIDFVSLFKDIAVAAFIIGLAFMLVRLAVGIYSVWRLIHSGRMSVIEEDVTLTVVSKLSTPFSWFGHIVASEEDMKVYRDMILSHELAHIRLRHSWDVMFVDLALCLWWFNPAMWLLRRELQSLHEYQADDAVLNEGVDAKNYQMLLIKRAAGARLHSVANCLNHSNLKNRITMMCKKTSSRWSAAKLLLILPLVALSLAATATTVYVPKEQNKGNENFVETQTVTADEEQPYIKVQQMPTFQGGDLNAYRNWMQSQLQYPKEAKDKGIKGRVIFSFVVEKDGSVSEFKVLNTPDKLLSAEVERVFKLTPKWEPGKQNGKEVRVKFTVPIVFTGDDVAVYNRVFSQGTPLSEMSKDAESAVGEVSGRVVDKNKTAAQNESNVNNTKFEKGDTIEMKSTTGESMRVKYVGDFASALVLIDGKEGKIENIGVDDIESFTVLKDEQATKIYGEKGKNGVVLIITKKAAQANKQQSAQEEAFIKVESMPTFQGGDLNGYRNWVQSQLQYPKEAKDKGVQGRVIFSFVVEKDGSVSEFKVLNTPDKLLSAEVERVFKLTPKWEPGKQNGKAVRVKFTVPITFTL